MLTLSVHPILSLNFWHKALTVCSCTEPSAPPLVLAVVRRPGPDSRLGDCGAGGKLGQESGGVGAGEEISVDKLPKEHLNPNKQQQRSDATVAIEVYLPLWASWHLV